jgi:hypothetical protein
MGTGKRQEGDNRVQLRDRRWYIGNNCRDKRVHIRDRRGYIGYKEGDIFFGQLNYIYATLCSKNESWKRHNINKYAILINVPGF